MTERLSDERLREITKLPGTAGQMARELLELRAENIRLRQRCTWLQERRAVIRKLVASRWSKRREVRRLRAKLAAGPVMPETPADSVIIASTYALVDFDRDLPVAASEADYRAIRKRLMFLEHNPDDT